MLRLLIALLLVSGPAIAKNNDLGQRNNDPVAACQNAGLQDCMFTGEIPRPREVLKLERVVDGDTIVAGNRKIRLWGINAPEKKDKLFPVATMFLEAILEGGELSCKFIEKDRYERNVMHCFVDDADIGSMMVQMGMAKDYQRYSGGYYQVEEETAKAERRGLWKFSEPNSQQH